MLWVAFVIATVAPPVVAADTVAQRGAALANACAACHGAEGRSKGAIPPLTAKSDQALREAMRGFRDGTRPGTVMNRLMQGLTDDDIDAIVVYFVPSPQMQRQQ
jgi:cytochrome subunit of sulfide dehydrogenase